MTSKKDLRNFGLIWTGIFILVFGYFFYKGSLDVIFLFIASGFLFLSLFFPSLLSYFYIGWIKFGNVIGWINTRLILIILFYGIFTPIGFLLKLFGKNVLEKKIDKKINTYWKVREEQLNSMDYQF